MKGTRDRLAAALALGVCVGLSAPSSVLGTSLPGIDYLSPEPGSERILEQTNIVIRPGGFVDGASIGNGPLLVTGSLSGIHAGTTRLSDDGQTVTFMPDAPFWPRETADCPIGTGITTSPLA